MTAAEPGRSDHAVPDDWQRVRLGDVALLRRERVMPAYDDPTSYVGLEHIYSGGSLHRRNGRRSL